ALPLIPACTSGKPGARRSLHSQRLVPPRLEAGEESRLPRVGHAVIIVDPLVIVAVEAWFLAGAEARAVLELVAVEIDDIAALVGVVGELAPGDRAMVLAEAENAAERHHSIFGLAAFFLWHEIPYSVDLLAL